MVVYNIYRLNTQFASFVYNILSSLHLACITTSSPLRIFHPFILIECSLHTAWKGPVIKVIYKSLKQLVLSLQTPLWWSRSCQQPFLSTHSLIRDMLYSLQQRTVPNRAMTLTNINNAYSFLKESPRHFLPLPSPVASSTHLISLISEQKNKKHEKEKTAFYISSSTTKFGLTVGLKHSGYQTV